MKTPHLEIGELTSAQITDPDVFNDGAWRLDALVHLSVITQTLATPPTAPVQGDRYIIAATATGAWAGHENHVCMWTRDGWIFLPPRTGWLVYVADETRWYLWKDTAWTLILDTDAVLTPTQLSASQNNYSPTGLSTADVLRLSSSTAVNITGLAGGVAHRYLRVINVGSSSITLKDESSSSTAANRFALSRDTQLSPDQGVQIWYDSTSSRWRLISASGAAATPVYGPDVARESPSAWDDEFEYGTTIDTTGARFTGATAWARNTSASTGTAPTITVADGALVMAATNNTGPHRYGMSLGGEVTTGKIRGRVGLFGTANGLNNYNAAGLYIYRSATGKLMNFTILNNTTPQAELSHWTDVTFSTATAWTDIALTEALLHSGIYLEIEWDASNVYWRWSFSGEDGTYINVGNESRAGWLGGAPDEVGVSIHPGNATYGATGIYRWFRKVA